MERPISPGLSQALDRVMRVMARGDTQRERESSAHDLHFLGVLGIGSDHDVFLPPSVPDDLGVLKLKLDVALLIVSRIRVF